MQKVFIIFIINYLFILTACTPKTNNNIIEEEKLINILIDIHITDAALSVKRIRIEKKNYLPSYYYNSIYDKYEITASQFDSSIMYYSKRGELFGKLYDKVIDSLNRLETKIRIELQNSPEKRDTVNLWRSKLNWHFPKDRFNQLSFNIPIKENGTYIIRADIKLYKDDSTENPRIQAYFWKKDSTPEGKCLFFDTIFLTKDNQFNYYETKLELSDTTFSMLKGYFFIGDNAKKGYYQHADINKIMIFNPKIFEEPDIIDPELFMY